MPKVNVKCRLSVVYRFNFLQIILCKVTKKNKFGGFRIFYWAVLMQTAAETPSPLAKNGVGHLFLGGCLIPAQTS